MQVLFRGFSIFSTSLALALFVGASTSVCNAQSSAPATDKNKTGKTQEDVPPWKWRPLDLRDAAEANKQALRLTTAVFEARLRRGEVEAKFTPKIVPPDKNDPLSGPNDLGGSPLLQDFGQGAVWLSIILSVKKTDLSPRLQEVQQGLLDGLQQTQTVSRKDIKKEVRKANRSKDLEDNDITQDIQLVLRAERNYKEVVSELRSAFPKYAELYLHESPRVLDPPGVPAVFELCDPAVSADPLEKNQRMQASLIVKVYRYDVHDFKIVSFWLYRNIDDPEIFVPHVLYTEKGRDATRNGQGLWDGTHMPPRTFSSVAYVSPAVTVLDVKFVDGEPIMTGRSAPAGRHRTQQVSLAGLDLNKLGPATEGALDVSVPSFPVSIPEIPSLPALAINSPALGTDYMPRIRQPYEFRTNGEYEAYLAGIREALIRSAPAEIAASSPAAKTASSTANSIKGAALGTAALLAPTNIASSPMSAEQLNPVFLNPLLEGGLNELSIRARDSLKQFADLQPVTTRNLINQLVARSNAGFRNHDPAAELLQQKLPKVRQVNIYFFASDNTTASWRGPDDTSGKGGIVTVLPTRYYSDPQQFYKSVASALINQPLASEDSARLSDYLGGAASRQVLAAKQFPIEINYVDHGWDENGDMQKWPDEAVDFFRHVQEAIAYLKPRLETIGPANMMAVEQEIPGVESWLNSLAGGSVTLNFGLYKGKDDAPPPKADSATRTVLISSRADEYVKAEKREYRWALWAKLMEGLNGLEGGSFEPGLASAVYDILELYGKDKDNKLMIAWRLNTDLPAKPASWPLLAGVSRVLVATSSVGSTEPAVARVPKAPSTVEVLGDGAANDAIPNPSEGTTEILVHQQEEPESAQTAYAKSSPVVAQSAPKEPELTERKPEVAQAAKKSGMQQADPEFAKQVSNLIRIQMKGIDDSSLRAAILQTMLDRLSIVRDPNPNFHSKVSSIDPKQPNSKYFDFTVNKTEYFNALLALAEKDGRAFEVIWSGFEANVATVEYATGNHDFGPLYTTLQSDLTATVKRHTNGAAVSQDIFDDPQFKALLPYYSSFWSNWQFAGERARFQCLHDRVTSSGLRRLAKEAAKSQETMSSKSELLRLADEVDLFYGESVQAPTALPAVEENAGHGPNSLDTVSIAHEPERESNKGITKPWEMPDYRMTQFISVLQKVQQPGGQRSQYQDSYRRAFIVYQVLDAWNRTDPGTKEKLIAGEWTKSDLRFVLPVLAEIHAGKLNSKPTAADIVKLSGNMPWIADPKYDLTKGALGKLPDALK